MELINFTPTLDYHPATKLYVDSAVGSISTGVKSLTYSDSPYTVLTSDRYLRVDCTSGNVVLNFQQGSAGLNVLAVKKIDSSANVIQCTPYSGEEIEGESGTFDISAEREVVQFAPVSSVGWEVI